MSLGNNLQYKKIVNSFKKNQLHFDLLTCFNYILENAYMPNKITFSSQAQLFKTYATSLAFNVRKMYISMFVSCDIHIITR